MDPAGAERHDRWMERKLAARTLVKDVPLSEFSVGELGSVMRVMGLEYSGCGHRDPTEQDITVVTAAANRHNAKVRVRMESLISLDEWNEQRRNAITLANTYPKPNGIACPECGAELQDTDTMVLTSYPAKRNVSCSKCEYQGYRIA